MKKSVLVIAVLALLGLAPAALAKELSLTAVCGPGGCKAISPAVKVGHEGFAPAAVPVGSYYVLRVGFGDGGKIFQRSEMYFAASPGAVVAKDAAGPTDGWGALPGKAAARVRDAAAGLKPYTIGRPTHAYLGGHRAVDPEPYLGLLGSLERVGVPRTAESPTTISLYWAGTNPWSNAGALIQYLPKAGVVIRSDGYYRAPGSIADRARRELAGLPPTVPGGVFPWGLLAAGLGSLAAVAAATMFVAWRRRRAPAPERAVGW